MSRRRLDPFTTLIFLARDDGRLFILRQLATSLSLFYQNSGYFAKDVHRGCGAMPRDVLSALYHWKTNGDRVSVGTCVTHPGSRLTTN
jgi:hypothetical protein